MKVERKHLLTAILTAALAPSISSAQGASPDLGLAADIPSLENTLIDSKIAVSAGDLEAMRDIATQPFAGNIAMNTIGTPVVLDAVREETRKEVSSNAISATVIEETNKDLSSTAEAGKPGLSAKVPALSNKGEGDDGNISNIYIKKGLKYTGIAVAATLLAGGAVAGGLLFGGPGVAIGVVAGAVVLGVLASKALHSFWNIF